MNQSRYTEWTIDPIRNQRYSYDSVEKVFLYENGTRVPAPGNASTGAQEQTIRPPHTAQAIATSSHGRVASEGSELSDVFSDLSINGSLSPGPSTTTEEQPDYRWPDLQARTERPGAFSSPSQYHGYGPVPFVPPHATFPWIPPSSYSRTSYPYGIPSAGHHLPQNTYSRVNEPQYPSNPPDADLNSQPSDREILQEVSRNTDTPNGPDATTGNTIHRHIKGSDGHAERLDKSFMIQPSGRNFFKIGRVFKMLWPELAGDINQNITVATTGLFGEKFFCKIRWFVVVRECWDSCTCLSIQTYRRRGVPPNKKKDQHAIMYTGALPPDPLASEQPRGTDELPMLDPIRVVAKDPTQSKMDPMSRVNFIKLYTVEHNVKVSEFGYVDPRHEHKLMGHFNWHWAIQGTPPAATRPPHGRSSQTVPPTPPGVMPHHLRQYHPLGAMSHHQQQFSPPSTKYQHQQQPYLSPNWTSTLGSQVEYANSAPMPPLMENTASGHETPVLSRRGYTLQTESSDEPTSMNSDHANPRHRRRRDSSSHGSGKPLGGRKRS